MILPRSDLLVRMGKSASKKKTLVRLAADDESARGRLLSAATHLFCKNGINATGIDAIINEAGTAKTTLYKLFGSKTNLVHAVLESEGKQWREWFIAAIEAGGGDAQTKARADLSGAEDAGSARSASTAAPSSMRSPNTTRTRSSSATSRCGTRRSCWRISKSSPAKWVRPNRQLFAHQLALLIDGAIVAAMVSRDPGVADTAALAAGSLFEPAKTKRPKRAACRGGVGRGMIKFVGWVSGA